MNYQDVIQFEGSGVLPRNVGDTSGELEGVCVINDLIALPLVAVSEMYSGDHSQGIYDFDVLDENGDLLGVLCLCKDYCRNVGDVDYNLITDAQFAAYIREVEANRFGHPFRFSKDYFVLKITRYNEYRTNYLDSAPIWGGFLHEQPGAHLPVAFQIPPTSIIASPGLTFPTPFHRESCIRSILQPYAFERFLKLYHLFELLFDYDLVQKIQNLGSDLQGIGQLLSEYNARELSRLNLLVKTRCPDIAKIAKCLDQIGTDASYFPIAESMFFNFGKEGNPFKDAATLRQLIGAGGFTHANARSVKVPDVGDIDKYNNFIWKCATYWIYRVRCSIAHNRIGEYVMTSKDESFVVNVAEPLLRELLKQAMV